MEKVLSGIDSIVVFENSQGLGGRGTLVHINRSTVVFEVYNPYSIVQLSEVLHGVRILRGDRTIYHGRAVVNSIVTTGLMVIVSAALLDAWVDLAGVVAGDELQEETERFIRDWEATHNLRPAYQLAVTNMRSFLAELSRWLEAAEAGPEEGGEEGRGESGDLQRARREAVHLQVGGTVRPKLWAMWSQFEDEAKAIPQEDTMVHKAFARRELHPLILCSPFVHRTYTKPLGYAGDYEMVNMVLGTSPASGQSVYAKLLNTIHLETVPSEGHRNRVALLERWLCEEGGLAEREGRPFAVLNVGCGPAVEIQRMVREDRVPARTAFHLLDFNRETLDFAAARIREAVASCSRPPEVNLVHRSIHSLLKESHEAGAKGREGRGGDGEQFDFVYCAGLFDYLSDRVCRRLVNLFYGWVRPGGLLVVTNVHPDNPVRCYMEHLLEWHLIYRDERTMRALAPPGREVEVTTEETGSNLFLKLRRPAEVKA